MNILGQQDIQMPLNVVSQGLVMRSRTHWVTRGCDCAEGNCVMFSSLTCALISDSPVNGMLIMKPFLYWGGGMTQTQVPLCDASWGTPDSLPRIWLNGLVISRSILSLMLLQLLWTAGEAQAAMCICV